MAKKKTHEVFVLDISKRNPNVEILGKYTGVTNRIKTKCKKCNYEWNPIANSVMNGYGCPSCCKTPIVNDESFKEEMNIVNPYIEICGTYKNAKTNIKCHCKVCDHIWSPIPDSLKRGYGCPHCGNIKKGNSQRKSEHDFKSQLLEIQPNIEIISPYLSARKEIKYKCKIHEYIGTTTPDNLLRGFGCPYCAGKIRTFESFYDDVKKYGNNIEFLNEFTLASSRMDCKCKKCGNQWSTSASHLLEGSGCPVCNVSKGEKRIAFYLSKSNIKFKSHKKYKNLLGTGGRNLSYDFYLPEFNLLIEFQGQQHEKAFDYFGGEERFKTQQEHDKRKREYALSHSIELLEIWYYDIDNIEQILQEKLNLSTAYQVV